MTRGAALCTVILAAGFLAAWAAIGAAASPEVEQKTGEPGDADPLVERGYTVTGGAAPGYVPDRVCAGCHQELYNSYQEVGMSRSFYAPRASNAIEDFASDGFYHEPSKRHYQMIRRDGRLVMKRHQLDASGEPINAVEQEVDWILGSGNHSRTYLYRTPYGELFQLPIAWYTQTQSWGMAPGFDRPDHLGLLRIVRRECMFCHNAYPDVPAASDAYSATHDFPEKLPEGVGCQRCHGPGAAHSRAAMRETVDFEEVFATILNPGDLEPRLRDDVCYQCHMQPTVAIPGQRRFGRHTYSFRPGEPLADYLVQVDIVEADQDQGERFEINHHPYRLEQSQCFQRSAGAMSCLSCHDPHRKVPEAERKAHYQAACLGCHDISACRLEEMASEMAAPTVAADDCAACHMPKRRTQDVVQVVMTDHLIQRRPGGPELLAPLVETDPVIDDIVLTDRLRAPEGALKEVYRAFAVAEFSAGGYGAAIEHLERMLPHAQPPEIEPYLALAKGQLKQNRPDTAKDTLEKILARFSDHPTAEELLALADSRLGFPRAAVARMLTALNRGQRRPETYYNLGVLLTRYDQPERALARLKRATELRPTMDAAWFFRGKAEAAMLRLDDAAQSFRQALRLNPTHTGAYLKLGQVLIQQKRRDEALRTWRHGAKHAKNPAPIAEALTGIELKPNTP